MVNLLKEKQILQKASFGPDYVQKSDDSQRDVETRRKPNSSHLLINLNRHEANHI